MIRKNIKLKKLFYNILVITSFIVTCLVFLQKIPNSSFIKYENYNIDEVISQNEKYDTKSLNNITTVLNDLLEGYTGEGYNLEEEYYSNVVSRSMDSIKQCDDHCSSHGPGHENGGINLLDTGCRNYMGWSYGNYGSLSIPIWINMTSMNTIIDVTHRNTLINDIRYQISLWNSVQMHDGSGTLVYLYEVGIGESTRPNNINGKKVVEILRKDGQYSGQFDPNDLQIRINYSYSSYNDRGGRNVDTPLHEMGHLLGLMDLEADGSGIAMGTHKTLMGYNRGATINTIDKAIKYQDIQGVAVFNNIHTEHKFDRFVLKNGRYLNICFYCDRIDSTISAKSGVLEMQSEKTCVHDFQPLVSCADNHWFKCTKCYKVIESDYYFNVEGTSTSRTIKILGPVNNSIQIANIPNKIIDINVTSIGADAFKNCKNLQKVVIPNTITNIDSSAFENCSYLQSVTLPTNLVAIDSSAFKGCGSLATITIPNGVTHIDSSAFENCSYLQSVTLPTNLVTIGSSAFKGCGSLGNITIPNSVTNIDSCAFENCSYLQTIILSSNLNAIGVSAFKGCESLASITIPSSVQYIDESAFENCVSLVSVMVEREISNITNLGNYAFAGCSSALQIIVPQNRVAEYKNKLYWSSYRSKIISDNVNYDEIDLYCLIDEEESVTLNARYNKLYKLGVDCTRSYKFVSDVSSKIIVYNSDMTVAYSGDNSLTAYLNKGTYYLSIEHSSVTTSGIININYALAYPTDGIAISYNSSNGTNIASGLHLTENNMYHARLKYTNYKGAGFYKFTLNAGASAIYPVNAIQVYTDVNRTNLLSMYSLSELDIFAQSNENENIMYIYLPENGTYYIDVTLPLSSYSSLTFNIQSIEVNNINYWNSLTSIGFDVLFENVNTQSCFEEVTISHCSEIQLDIISSGTIYNDIKVYVFKKVRDPRYEPGINYYYIESVYIDEITSTNRSPVFTLILDPGTYYFGYAENEDNVNINFALRRMVDYNMNMEGILVADPYYTGYDLGTEVLFNEGECDKYYITEGFTRNIYLMVEDRLRDPMSRLDYDWYSSNEAVATVTNYGTVLAMPVTTDTEVTIYAVLKDDPKIVYYRTFTVLNDEEEDLIEIELNMSYSYVAENGTYQLELTNINCPYPMIQYYSWNIINNSEETVTMNYWGQISSTGTCTVLIEGTYNLNSRVRLYITLTIE